MILKWLILLGNDTGVVSHSKSIGSLNQTHTTLHRKPIMSLHTVFSGISGVDIVSSHIHTCYL